MGTLLNVDETLQSPQNLKQPWKNWMAMEVSQRLEAEIDAGKWEEQEALRRQYEATHCQFGASLGNASG